ncbi:hypothetical protein GGI22_005145, partial [Coemansia erecta]
MKFFITAIIAAAAVLAQQQDQNQGPNLSDGPSAVSNPNINNGDQFQGSFVDGSTSGRNQISGAVDGSFNHQASNSDIQDSNFVNPSQNSLSGNKGNTANGEGNSIGDIFGVGGFFRRQSPPPIDAMGQVNAEIGVDEHIGVFVDPHPPLAL